MHISSVQTISMHISSGFFKKHVNAPYLLGNECLAISQCSLDAKNGCIKGSML